MKKEKGRPWLFGGGGCILSYAFYIHTPALLFLLRFVPTRSVVFLSILPLVAGFLYGLYIRGGWLGRGCGRVRVSKKVYTRRNMHREEGCLEKSVFIFWALSWCRWYFREEEGDGGEATQWYVGVSYDIRRIRMIVTGKKGKIRRWGTEVVWWCGWRWGLGNLELVR